MRAHVGIIRSLSPLAGSRARPAVWRAALALATFVTGLFLIPIESDGALVSDGIWYGIEMESSPAKAVHGNHPLFHLIAWPLAAAARAAGFTHPGHVAYRIVAAAGGAILVSIVAAFGGRRAAWFGLAAAGYVAASRMSVIESATSENVGPATAAALAAAWAALHRRRRPVVAGALLALAMTLRQDNILLVPGIAMTLFPRGRRRGPLVAFLAATAVPVLAVYVLAWRIADPDASFLHYLLGLGTIGAYAPAASGTSFATLEAVALSDAFIGRHATGAAAESLLGLAVLLLPIALAWTRTGFRRMTREAWLFGSPVLLRFFFYGWYEPANPEWQFLAIAFSCAAAARPPRTAGPRRRGPRGTSRRGCLRNPRRPLAPNPLVALDRLPRRDPRRGRPRSGRHGRRGRGLGRERHAVVAGVALRDPARV